MHVVLYILETKFQGFWLFCWGFQLQQNNSLRKSCRLIVPSYLLVSLIYLGLALGYFPGLRMNRASIVLTGAALLLALGRLNLQQAWQALDPNTLIFLFGVMVLNAHLAFAGFFQLALERLLWLAKSPLGLMVTLTLGSGALSALFLNDTIALILTPLVLKLCQSLGLNPIPYLLALAGATNIGSVATLTGNPQNILIGAFSKISYLEFAQTLAPVALGGLFCQIGLLYLLYPEVRSHDSLPPLPPLRYRVHRALLIKGIGVTAGLLLAFLFGYPLAQGALIAAGILLISRRVKPERVFAQVDWELLVLFSGLFIITRAVEQLGFLQKISFLSSNSWEMVVLTTILANLISNVPAVLLLHQWVPQGDTQGWLLLAAASTLAGNLTLLGSVANLIVAEAAAKLGQRLSFLEHLRFGLPLTVVTLLIAYFWLD
jgi:Na+/H+ antiporter NhaD/arsenite permease-like protein